jgi:thioredoxin-related protein
LNRLQVNDNFNSLKIFPINVGRESVEKSVQFYKDLKINNLETYFDFSTKLPNKFALRGLPSTIFINKNGEEIGRIIGYVDFENKDLINWLKEYDS